MKFTRIQYQNTVLTFARYVIAALACSLWTTSVFSADLKDAISLMRANIDGFDHFNCEYEVISARSLNESDAKSNKWLKPPLIGKGTWIKSGKKSIIRFIEDEKITMELAERKMHPVPGYPALRMGAGRPFSTLQQLSTDRSAMTYNARDSLAQTFAKNDFHNLGMQRDNPYKALSYGDSVAIDELPNRISSGEYTCSDSTTHDNGSNGLEFTVSTSSGYTRILTFDPSKGYLPVQIINKYNGPRAATSRLSTIGKEQSGKRWFPFEIIYTEQNSPTVCLVYICRVIKFDTTTVPPDGEFAIDLPPGTTVHNPLIRNGIYKAKQAERITPENIDKVLELTERKPKEPLMDTAIAQPPFFTRYQWPLIGAAAGVLLLLAGYFTRKRRPVPA